MLSRRRRPYQWRARRVRAAARYRRPRRMTFGRRRKLHRHRNEYLKRVFKDSELYTCSFIDILDPAKQQWNPNKTWSVANARYFTIPLNPYPIGTPLFVEMCKRYRWIKFNYYSIYIDVMSYSYTADVSGSISDPAQRVPGKISLNVPSIGPLQGKNMFNFAWNLDSLLDTNKLTHDKVEASVYTRKCKINGNKPVKFFFKVPAELRRYVGTDHVITVDRNQALNDYFNLVIGSRSYHRIPEKIIGMCDDFTEYLRLDYTSYKDAAGNTVREPGMRLGLKITCYLSVTFKGLIDM